MGCCGKNPEKILSSVYKGTPIPQYNGVMKDVDVEVSKPEDKDAGK